MKNTLNLAANFCQIPWHTLKISIVEQAIHLEAMLVVALIAIARKIILLEPNELPEGTLLGIGVVVLALTLGYYLVRRSRWEKRDSNSERTK